MTTQSDVAIAVQICVTLLPPCMMWIWQTSGEVKGQLQIKIVFVFNLSSRMKHLIVDFINGGENKKKR